MNQATPYTLYGLMPKSHLSYKTPEAESRGLGCFVTQVTLRPQIIYSVWCGLCHETALRILYEEHDFRRYQSGQPTVFSDTYIITVPQYIYTWLILKFCGRSGLTGTFGNSVPRVQNAEPSVVQCFHRHRLVYNRAVLPRRGVEIQLEKVHSPWLEAHWLSHTS